MCTPCAQSPGARGPWPPPPTPARAGLSPTLHSRFGEQSQGPGCRRLPSGQDVLRCASSLGASVNGGMAVRGMGWRPRLHKEPDHNPQGHPQEPTLGKKPASRTDADSAQVDVRVEQRARRPACPLPGLGDLRLQQGLGTARTEAGWRSEEGPLCSPQGSSHRAWVRRHTWSLPAGDRHWGVPTCSLCFDMVEGPCYLKFKAAGEPGGDTALPTVPRAGWLLHWLPPGLKELTRRPDLPEPTPEHRPALCLSLPTTLASQAGRGVGGVGPARGHLPPLPCSLQADGEAGEMNVFTLRSQQPPKFVVYELGA